MAELRLLGACGLYCGACYHFRASFAGGKHLLEEARLQGRSPAGYTCQGCRSDALYIHEGCSQCEIRACTDARGIPHCGLCTECPCEQLRAFHKDGHIHHLDIFAQLEEIMEEGSDRWLAEQAQRWRCRCGTSYSWYEEICHHCGAPLDSYARRRATRDEP